ncbi:MAG: hypothetical protein GX278_01215 [Aeromonadales bacterium]|nr:hypothetical protein [Aeromonadales bacterium]
MAKNNVNTVTDSLKVKQHKFQDNSLSLKNKLDKKYNVKFDNEDLELLNELQSFYGLKNKSDLIQIILANYLKKSLHEDGVARDVALSIAMIADAYKHEEPLSSDVTSWEQEVISYSDYSNKILNYGPAAKLIKLSNHGGVEHSESFLQVGIKLMQFCERKDLITTKAYKKLFKALEQWNSLIKKDEK